MTRLLIGVLALAACAPAENRASWVEENGLTDAAKAPPADAARSGPAASAEGAGRAPESAAQGPIPDPISAAANPAPDATGDSPAEARGRRTLSTAFVRVGPDNLLTVELRDGSALVLRDVTMRPRAYCGLAVEGAGPARKHCGKYADVVAARPGGRTAAQSPDLAAPNPLAPGN